MIYRHYLAIYSHEGAAEYVPIPLCDNLVGQELGTAFTLQNFAEEAMKAAYAPFDRTEVVIRHE
jgi:hypothetical protein